MDINEVFWTNVLWHEENKGLALTEIIGTTVEKARDKKVNITLRKIQKIADALDIDDYAILFEQLD